jgi:Cof subfamily protein (haloacid dehalogenase superfamily)
MPSRRIVFLDIDGTIIDHSGRVPDASVDAIRRARQNGHLVLLSTGRSPLEIDDRLDEIGFDGAVTAAGAFAQVDGEWLVERLMSVEQATRMAEAFEQLGLDYTLQGRDEVYPTPGHRERFRKMLPSYGADQSGNARKGLQRILDAPSEPKLDRIAKAVFAGDTLDSFHRVHEALSPDYAVITGTIPRLGTASGEVSLPGVNKGTAILLLLDILGIDVADSLALGDNNNDLEMLAAVGTGIAMGNGTPEAKAAADEVTAAVDEDGLAHAFLRHGLI